MPENYLTLEARVAILETQIKNILQNYDDLDRVFTSIKNTGTLETKVAVLEAEVASIQAKLDKKVEKNEFWPIRVIVYGLAGMILLAVGGALIAGVVPTTTKVAPH